MSTAVTSPGSVQVDPRLAAFCSRGGPEVFSAIVHASQVWTPDRFDVPHIHLEAREEFGRLVNRATATPRPGFGKILLLLGEAGSGKTHLMRAFRTQVHAAGSAYFGYLQMVTRSDNYPRYILSNLITALDQPYRPNQPASGLGRLASGLLGALVQVPLGERQRIREEALEPAELADAVHRLADSAVQDPRFARVDIDVIRGVLYMLSPDNRIRPRVVKWLRCEDLGRHDRALIGDLVPRPQDGKPLETIADLARLMAAVHNSALVLCVDQLEDMIDQTKGDKDPGEVFRRVIDALVAVMDAVPTAVVVVGCLEDYFTAGRQYLNKPKWDRLEHDPDPIRLGSKRSMPEIEAIIGRRLEYLFESLAVPTGAESPTYPFRAEHLQRLSGLRTRDILDWCRQHQQRCIGVCGWVEPDGAPPAPQSPAASGPETLPLAKAWNDFLAAYTHLVVDDEESLAELTAGAVKRVSDEMPDGIYFGAETQGRFVQVEIHGAANSVEKLLVALCEKNARGGGLGKEVKEVIQRAGEIPAVVVRSTPFPASPAAEVSKLLAGLIAPKGKGRRVVVENSDWRAMSAFEKFHQLHRADPAYSAWRKQDRPLAALPALRAILALDKLPATARATPPPHTPALPVPLAPPAAVAPVPVFPPAATKMPPEPGPLRLGVQRGAAASPVLFEPRELTQHAAFLGGSGSGKTTAALTLIEQLVLRGIPAVLLDRKGDLARFADPGAWTVVDDDAARSERRRALRERIDVALFTPGAAQGRPLALPLAPAELSRLPEADREQIAGYVAAALGRMMGYKSKGIDPKLAILGKAIELLAELPGRAVTVRELQTLIHERDEALTLAVGGLEDKHYKRLAEDLQTLSLQRRQLLDGGGKVLDIDDLLGLGAYAVPGKTRLAVVSTQFLGGPEAVDFWLAQFLIAVDRWRERHPSPDGRLQAVFLFDEADQYLPATRQPATKAPFENLLKRARSAGVGLFLATQSPGDLDYKCRDQVRTWLVGRVKEPVALAKLKPLLEAGKLDATTKLPGQGPGQFFLAREKEVTPVQSDLSLITTAQLPDSRILELARESAKKT